MAEPASADLSRGPVLLSFSLATASFALATTFVRLYSRRRLHGGFGSDDYTSGAATTAAFLGTIFGVLEGGTSDPARALQFHIIGQPWYLVSSTLSKVSICLYFASLLRRARHWRTLLAYLILIMAVVNLAYGLAFYLQCRPLEKVWNPLVAGDCMDPAVQADLSYAQGAFSVFSWVFLALFPTLILRDLSRGGRPSWPFYATSALSFACGIFVIVRTAQASQTTGTNIYTIHFFYASLMANLEQNIALITSNLLTFGALFSAATRTGSSSSNPGTNRSRSRGRGHRRNRTRSRARPRDPYSSATSSTTLSSTSSISKGKAPRRPSNRSTTPRPPKPASSGSGSNWSGAPPSRTDSTRSITRRPSERSRSQAGSRAGLHRGDSRKIKRKEVGSGSTNTNGNNQGSSVVEDNNAGWDRDLERGAGGWSGKPDEEAGRESEGQTRYPYPSNQRRGPSRLGKGVDDYESDESDSSSDGESSDSDSERDENTRPPTSRSASRRDRRDGESNSNDDNTSNPSSSDDDDESDYSDDEDDDDDSDYESDRGSDISLEAWPRGIIKTVSVEVIEEVNEEYVAAMAAAEAAAKAGGTDSNGNPFVTIPPPVKLNGAPPIPPPPRGHARGLSGRSTTSVTGPGGSSSS
ncbi:hypothetical protein VTJ49DRAFT_2828 [Mycothermus thermophilus]|uniref:Rhodopsin domain-containing protein n=1 Tax=Humicola insolens TaxID=85995 RepID=A0ABR3V936_HUMIN